LALHPVTGKSSSASREQKVVKYHVTGSRSKQNFLAASEKPLDLKHALPESPDARWMQKFWEQEIHIDKMRLLIISALSINTPVFRLKIKTKL
jgi:hypothetical protein